MTTTTLHNIDHLNARDVADLVEAAAWPSVTLLLDTAPADRMTMADVARLNELVEDAQRQLASRGCIGAAGITSELRALARDAASMPTGRGLVLLASRAVQRAYRLPDTVAAQAVVEETFRTRELLQTLHRTPPHLLLLLHPTCAQLYRVYADTLSPLQEDGFPVQLAAPTRGRLQAGDDLTEDLLAHVEHRLAHARRRHPAPIIVAGEREQVGRLVRRSRHLHRLAGVLTGHDVTDATRIYLAAKASLEEYLRARQEEATLLLQETRRNRPDTIHSGIDEAWRQMTSTAKPLMLLVEESYHFPAIADDDGGIRRLDRPSTPEAVPPGTHTDLIDDLIELVIDRGGWVAFADDGTLSAHDRVALLTEDA